MGAQALPTPTLTEAFPLHVRRLFPDGHQTRIAAPAPAYDFTTSAADLLMPLSKLSHGTLQLSPHYTLGLQQYLHKLVSRRASNMTLWASTTGLDPLWVHGATSVALVVNRGIQSRAHIIDNASGPRLPYT